MRFIQVQPNKYIIRRDKVLPGSNQHVTIIARSKRLRLRSVLAGSIMLAAMLYTAAGYIIPFYNDIKPQMAYAPTKLVSPLPLNKILNPIQKAHAEEGVVNTPNAAEFARRVSMLESSGGKNTNPEALHNICKARGGSNIYGYGGMALMICFDSPEEATARITRWYNEHRATRTEAQTYCYYNTGLDLDTCGYWERAQAL